jgi:hypothetical protein
MIPRHLFRGGGIVRLSDQAPRTAIVPLLASTRYNGPKPRGSINFDSNWRALSQSARKNRPYHQDSDERLRSARPLVPDALAGKFTNAGTGRNSRTLAVVTVAAAIAFYMYNSQTVPVTGRRRFNFLSDTLVAQAYARAAEAIVRQVEEQGGHFLSDWDPRTILVKRVMRRLIPVSGMENLDWEVRVIADSREFLLLLSLFSYRRSLLTFGLAQCDRNGERIRYPRRQSICPQRHPQRLPQRRCPRGCPRSRNRT